MPYLRLHSPDLSLAKKHLVAQKLIDVTLHAFQLAPEERSQVTIQFIPWGLGRQGDWRRSEDWPRWCRLHT